jgi:hypothetical protein
MSRRFPALAVLCALALAPLAASAEIYRWTDEQGHERFSDRIEAVPERFRRDVTGELGTAREPAPDPAPIATLPAQEPPSAPAPEAPPAPTAQLPDWSQQLLGLGLAVAFVAALLGLGLWLVLLAFVLRVACRLVGEEVPGFGRALAVAAVQIVVGIVVGALLGGVALAGVLDPASLAFQGVQILVTFGVHVTVIQVMLVQSFGRALAVALVALLLTVGIGVALGLAIVFGLGGLVASSPPG